MHKKLILKTVRQLGYSVKPVRLSESKEYRVSYKTDYRRGTTQCGIKATFNSKIEIDSPSFSQLWTIEELKDIFINGKVESIEFDNMVYSSDIKPNLIVMVGYPACGKSTWVENFIHNADYTVISSDNFIMDALATDEVTTYDEVAEVYRSLSTAGKRVITLNREVAFRDLIIARENIIIDMTNLTIVDRAKALEPCNKAGYRTCIVEFMDDIETCKARKREGKTIPNDVYDAMNAKRERVEVNECDDYVRVNLPKSF